MEFDLDLVNSLPRNVNVERLIAEVVTRLAPQLWSAHLPKRALNDLHIILQDRLVHCGGQTLDLTRSPMIWRLFELFQHAPSRTLSRRELARALYDFPDAPSHTARYRAAIHGNLVKLISRARLLAGAQFGGESDAGIDWFAYDHSTQTWALFRLGPIRGQRHLAHAADGLDGAAALHEMPKIDRSETLDS